MTPFHPTPGNTVSIAATSTPAAVLLGGQPAAATTFQLRVWNNGTTTAFIKSGDSTVVASVTKDMPIPAGAVEVLTFHAPSMPANPSLPGAYVSAVTVSGTTNLYFTTGVGL